MCVTLYFFLDLAIVKHTYIQTHHVMLQKGMDCHRMWFTISLTTYHPKILGFYENSFIGSTFESRNSRWAKNDPKWTQWSKKYPYESVKAAAILSMLVTHKTGCWHLSCSFTHDIGLPSREGCVGASEDADIAQSG